MPVYPGWFDALCTSDGKQNGTRESAKKNWPLRHRSLNKTKPNAYLNVWGRRGFTLEQSCSNMRCLHSVQLPSHCGLGKQYSSPMLPPPPKKPPTKLVFLWPVIKTWVWMRASVSPGKITHTRSQWGGTNAVYSSPPQHLIGKKWFILLRLADAHNWPGHVLHLSNSSLTSCVYVCTKPIDIRVRLLIHVCVWRYLCYLLIRFRAQILWPLSHDNLPDLNQTCRKTEESEPSHHANNTNREEQFPAREKILSVCLRHVCTQRCALFL